MVAIRKPLFVVPLDLGVVASSLHVEGHPASNLNRLDGLGLTWVAPDGSAAWIRGQLPQQGAIDFCSIVSANAQAGTTYRLRLGNSQAAVDGGSAAYDSGTLPFISPAITRADGLYHSHLELPATIGATCGASTSQGTPVHSRRLG